jgi:hypothetical protein
MRVVYLGGLGRSGTTLLERMLGEVPGVCALGEVVHLWRRDVRDGESCGCGRAFADCEFWVEVGERAFGGWHNVDVERVLHLQGRVERTRHIPRLAVRRARKPRVSEVATYADYYARVYRAAAVTSGASVIVDSSKHSALAYCLRFAQLDLRVVHVVRDSRGVAYSWTKHVERPEAAGTEMTRYSPSRTAMLWNAHNSAFGMLRATGVPTARVRYEELIERPRPTLTRIAAFAGIDISTDDLDFLKDDQVMLGGCHSAAGNPMRFVTGDIPLRRDDTWVAALPSAQRRLVGALTAPLLGAYGYQITGRRA